MSLPGVEKAIKKLSKSMGKSIAKLGKIIGTQFLKLGKWIVKPFTGLFSKLGPMLSKAFLSLKRYHWPNVRTDCSSISSNTFSSFNI